MSACCVTQAPSIHLDGRVSLGSSGGGEGVHDLAAQLGTLGRNLAGGLPEESGETNNKLGVRLHC